MELLNLFGVSAILVIGSFVLIAAGDIVLEFLRYLFTVEINGKKY